MAQTLANALRIGFRVVSLISHSRSGWQSESSWEVVDDFVSEGASSYNKSHSNQTAAAIHSIKSSCAPQNSIDFSKHWHLVRDQEVGGSNPPVPNFSPIHPPTPLQLFSAPE